MTASVDSVALSLLPRRWRREIAEHLRAGRSAGDLLSQLFACPPARSELTLERIRARAARALARAETCGIASLSWDEPAYPAWLGAIADPPPVLWSRGRVDVLSRPAVAIVGSRAGSPYALTVAARLAGELATAGYAIVSGLARGVDSAAHQGALDAGGPTVAVLGSGVDVTYPREHEPLARAIAEEGAVVSELVPGTPPQPHFFPMRNRIISGLSRAVVVIEAGEKSGSLITARAALDQGREVLAVPGGVLTGRNKGGHALLRDGAKIVETADDILEEIEGVGRSGAGRGVHPRADAHPLDDAVLVSLETGEPSDVDAIAARSGLSAPALLPRLLELELRGLVARMAGGRYVRVDRTC
jgi:DNA processing protein